MPHQIKTALIATDPFVPTLENGWHQEGPNRVFVAQPTVPLKEAADYRAELETLWKDFESALPEIERVVVFFNSLGAEELLEKLSSAKLAPNQVFIYCDCKISDKVALLLKHGFSKATSQVCKCGVDYMCDMYLSLLGKGMLLLAS